MHKKNTRTGAYQILFLLILLLAFTTKIPAQNYEFRIQKVTNEKGEDPGATFAIAEDSLGFIWFGTVDGLYRFDGFNYKVYRNKKDNPNSLGWNTIRALCMDNQNNLWIGTQGAGLDCYDLKTEKFTHYNYEANRPDWISGTDVWAMIADSKGNIWAGVSGNGIDMLDRKANVFKHYPVLPQEIIVNEPIQIRSVCEANDGTIWIGMAKYGLSALNPATGKVKNYCNIPNNSRSLGANDVFYIFKDREGNIWVCPYGGGLIKYDPSSDSFIRYRNDPHNQNSLVSNLTRALIEKHPGEYWIGTEYGLTVFDPGNNLFTSYQHDKSMQNSLADNRIRVIYQDRKGLVWIASEAGVDKIVGQKNFRVYKNSPGNLNTLPDGIVRTVMEDDEKNLWIGLIDKGLVRYKPGTKDMKQYIHDPLNPRSISGRHVTASFQDSNGDLWFGEWDTGLNRYNKRNGSFELIASTNNTKARLLDNRIQFIKEAKPGILWIGTENGLNRLDTRTNTCTYYVNEPGNPNSISGNSTQSNAFVQDSSGNIWIGTWSEGLNRIEFLEDSQQKTRITRYKYDPAQPDRLNNNNVISLHLDKRGVLWIGTFGGGLNKFDLKSGKFTHYTTENGLPNNIIFAILEDSNHHLWLSTDRGLSRFDPVSESFQNFDKSDGLQDDHFFWGSSYKSQSGELFFGGIAGLNSFIPEKITYNSLSPLAVLTDLKIAEQSVDYGKPINTISEITLPYKQSYITFEYIALDFTDPGKNLYKVKMEGLDEDWRPVGNNRISSYSNLPPARYTFRLKASNNDGVWSKNEIHVTIIVTPPWWKTWYARAAIIFLFLGIILAFYFIRLGILEARTRTLEEQVKARTREIMDQKEAIQAKQEELNIRNEELGSALDSLQKTQNQLIQSEKMASLGTLVAGIAHEINNPVNFISSGWQYFQENIEKVMALLLKYRAVNSENLDQVLKETGKDEESMELQFLLDNYQVMSRNITTGIDRTTEIILSLNTYSRSEKDEVKRYSLKDAIKSSIIILENKYKGRITIWNNIGNIPDILCNPGKINQLFLNVLSNAIDATPSNGTIEISSVLDQAGKEVEIIVTDSGKGISPENLSHVFDPFFTTKDVGKGSGLGLYISYLIVEQHNGRIKINSARETGTEVRIMLPIDKG